ncbi:tetratricopeptide repeat protein [Flavobacterium sp. NST-5]|uniref:Tetratricopeptide repeat protein n=1 Tax=Flavobacterium ichthyis TaxID=2698827 RepID=A0ABW9Z7S6_9FLAO|nr:tetratricopeptide repeat protein [Flavobacterium ichthyis]NBL64922.1 tetratricopeptide repeat protein [Flavobacterium ichthyis]
MQNSFITFLITFLSAFVGAFGQVSQEKYVDSLLTTAEKLPPSNTFEILELGLKAYGEAKKANLKKQMAAGLIIAGKQEVHTKNLFLAEKHADEAIIIGVSIENYQIISDAYRLKGLVLGETGKFVDSRIFFHESLKFAKKIADEELRRSRLGIIYNDLAYNFDQYNHQHDSVVKYYKMGFEQLSQMNLHYNLKAKTKSLAYLNIGNAYLKFHKLDSAVIYLNQSRQIASDVRHKTVEAGAMEALGNVYRMERDYDKAILMYLQAIPIAQEIKDWRLLKKLYFNVSMAYDESSDHENSKKYLNEYIALADSIENGGYETDSFISEKLQVFKSREGFFRKALVFVLFCVVFLAIVFYIFRKKNATKNSAKHIVKPVFSERNVLTPDDHQRILKNIVSLAERDDPSFLLVFRKSFPKFFETLLKLNPALIASEQKLCAFAVLNFTTKEIAVYTNSSVRAIEAKRYRLRKKLSIPTEADLNLWLIDLFEAATVE